MWREPSSCDAMGAHGRPDTREDRRQHVLDSTPDSPRGDFERLNGWGRPIPDLDETCDAMWWVRRWMRRNGVTHTQVRQALQTLVAERRGRGAKRP